MSRKIKCSRCAVQTSLKRYMETRSYQNRPKTGRNRNTTPRQDRLLQRMCLRNRKLGSKDLAKELNQSLGISISAVTVRRRLGEFGLRGSKPRNKPWLSEVNKKKRFEWAKNYKDWTCNNWAKVIWSDECNVEVCNINFNVSFI